MIVGHRGEAVLGGLYPSVSNLVSQHHDQRTSNILNVVWEVDNLLLFQGLVNHQLPVANVLLLNERQLLLDAVENTLFRGRQLAYTDPPRLYRVIGTNQIVGVLPQQLQQALFESLGNVHLEVLEPQVEAARLNGLLDLQAVRQEPTVQSDHLLRLAKQNIFGQ